MSYGAAAIDDLTPKSDRRVAYCTGLRTRNCLRQEIRGALEWNVADPLKRCALETPSKRRSGQLAPSNHDPQRSNDPVGRIVVNGAHNATIWRARSSILDPRSKSFCNENPGIEPIAIGQNSRPIASRSIRPDEQIGTTLPLCNRRPFSVAHSHKQMRDGPLAQPVDALHTHDVISRLLENMRCGGESVLRVRHYITV